MNTYRSLSTIQAVQFTGAPIPGITCGGSDQEYREKGCDNSRRYNTHVHTAAIGGMTVLRPGDWIYPTPGGPFAVASDEKFRGSFEVPAPVAPDPEVTAPVVPDPVVPDPVEEATPVVAPDATTDIPVTVGIVDGTFNASSLPPAKPEEILSDFAKIDDILADAKEDANS